MSPGKENIEQLVQDMGQRVENLKLQFNLFFSGEIRIPPEKERQELEIRIRNLMSTSSKSARVSLLIQNLSSRFSLFNNMWLKRLTELETGVSTLVRKKTAYTDEINPPLPSKAPPKPKEKSAEVSLNREESFEKLFDDYSRMLHPQDRSGLDKEQVINTIKTKLITENLVDAQVNLSLEKGKVKIKIKSSF